MLVLLLLLLWLLWLLLLWLWLWVLKTLQETLQFVRALNHITPTVVRSMFAL